MHLGHHLQAFLPLFQHCHFPFAAQTPKIHQIYYHLVAFASFQEYTKESLLLQRLASFAVYLVLSYTVH